jgi:hypothetical protein
MTERKEAVRAWPEAQRRRIDAAMLQSLSTTFRMLAGGQAFMCSFHPQDVADMLTRASVIVDPKPRPLPEDTGRE